MHRWWQVAHLSIVGDPLRWKERNVEGIAPLGVLRQVPRWFGMVLVVAGTVFFSTWTLTRAGSAVDTFSYQGLCVMVLASLVVGIRCSGAITGEREKQTWEALLVTPLETRRLVRGKLWGIVGACFPYLAAYGITVLPFAMFAGLEALLLTVLHLGLTVMAMCYVGAAGLWCSARCSTSWRSLLLTLGFGYVGGFVMLGLPTMLVAMIMKGILYMALAVLEGFAENALAVKVGGLASVSEVATFIAMAGAFCVMTEVLIVWAEKVVGRERIKQWDRVPVFVRFGRRQPIRPVRNW
jgi:ABC-type transport system involved in multi-copper enzyme maturation permease subunit